MTASPLLPAMIAHLSWVVLLYAALTVARAPAVWGSGESPGQAGAWKDFERRVSANLNNQFEWPLFFYAICILLIHYDGDGDALQNRLAWVFVAGRVIHSLVQIFANNIRLRGVVFTINFVAVLAMWARFLAAM